ncbi:MAG: DUF3796 domain-containing protein [Candidatus Aminicenantes bacterium]|nr:DUF3796 domain-containing protein [Candidatus Aminicenantes bacterium]
MEASMKSSWLKYLGFLGFLGFLGLFTRNIGFYGFFGFFGFFTYAKIIRDERLEENINKSARNAFIVMPFVFVISTVVVSVMNEINVYIYAFIALVILQILIFTVSLKIYEKR